MSNTKELGKITSVHFGLGGYQDCQFGLSLSFEGKSGWGCGTFIGNWDVNSIEHNKNSEWTEKDRSKWHDDLCRKVSKLLQQAKVNDVSKLLGKPVEIEFESNALKSWRILEEVL